MLEKGRFDDQKHQSMFGSGGEGRVEGLGLLVDEVLLELLRQRGDLPLEVLEGEAGGLVVEHAHEAVVLAVVEHAHLPQVEQVLRGHHPCPALLRVGLLRRLSLAGHLGAHQHQVVGGPQVREELHRQMRGRGRLQLQVLCVGREQQRVPLEFRHKVGE